MPVYKCPACGRSNIDIPGVESIGANADITLTLPGLETHVTCKECGWSGPVSELKVGH